MHSWNPVDPNHDSRYQIRMEHLVKSIDFFDYLIFNSPHSYERGISIGFEYPNETHIITPPVSEPFLEADSPSRFNLTKTIVFVGSLNENKNIQKLINSMTNFHLITG